MTLWTQHWHICIKGHKTYLHQSATNHTNENLSCPIHEHYWLQHHTNENWSCPIHEYYWLEHHTIENWSSIHEHYWLQHHTNENLSCLIHEHYWLQRYTNENWSCPIHEHYWLQHHTNENWSCPIHEYCLWPCQSQEALRNFPVPEDLVAVVLQILLQHGVPDLVAVVLQILLQRGVPEDLVASWCSRRSCCCGVHFLSVWAASCFDSNRLMIVPIVSDLLGSVYRTS